MSKDHNTPAVPALMLGGSYWAMRRDALPRLDALTREALAKAVTGEISVPTPQAATVQTAPEQSGVAVITLSGVLTPFGSLFSYLFGGGSGGLQGFRNQLSAAVADPAVAAIVLDIDSPGGSTGLCAETAADVLAARESKPIYAVADVQACSGAYWIGSQADEFYVTPSGVVGSVGVYYYHVDYSKMNEEFGVNPTYVFSGEHKVDGNDDEPLSPDARAMLQHNAETIYSQFIDAVNAGRGATSATSWGDGAWMLAQDAVDGNLVDGIATLEEVLAKAFSSVRPASGARAQSGRSGFLMPPARAAADGPDDEAAADQPEPVEDDEDERPAPGCDPDDDETEDDGQDDDGDEEDATDDDEPSAEADPEAEARAQARRRARADRQLLRTS